MTTKNEIIKSVGQCKEGADLFDLMGLALFLEGKLKTKVDVVSKTALREELEKSILEEVAFL